jgi:hypothetical protein
MNLSHTTTAVRRGAARLTLVGAAAAVFGAAAVAPASAIEFKHFEAETTNLSGGAERQAGAHPDTTVEFMIAPREDSSGGAARPVDQPHQLTVDMPAGFLGNPQVAERCDDVRLKAGVGSLRAACPVGSQVGLVTILKQDGSSDLIDRVPIFNVVPPDDRPAIFAFNYLGAVVKITPSVRPTDYGITVDSGAISQGALVWGARVTLWGVPADRSHNPQRWGPQFGGLYFDFPATTQAPRKPFLSLPGSCTSTPSVLTARLDGWEAIGQFAERKLTKSLSGRDFVTTDCDKMPFIPGAQVSVPTRQAEAPSGMEVELTVPQPELPDAPSAAHVRNVTMQLPSGMVVSPSSAAGLQACSPAQIAMGTHDVPTCPRASKLGTVVAETPVLEHALEGDVYLATPHDNPSGSLLGLYIDVKGPGFRVKIAGRVNTDPQTGQITATFANNPQVPVSSLKVKLPGGENASVATPAACGHYTAATDITSWATAEVHHLTSAVNIDEGCDRGAFAPVFSAGPVGNAAGASSEFALRIERGDGQPHLRSVTTTMPAGLLANVGSVPLCGEADAAAGSCPESSRVGTTRTLAGPGNTPLGLPGKVFLTGGYKGAPYGLAIVVRAIAGPFDLGTVVVRAAIHVDSRDGHVTVVSDPIPNMLNAKGKDGVDNGFLLLVREVQVNVDRPGFMLNPTNCAPKEIAATIGAVPGQSVNVASRFQAADCSALGLEPKLALTLSGKGQTTDGKHPAISAVLTQAAGDSNLKKVKVTLPLSLALDPDNAESDGLCSFIEGSKDDPKCPASSVVGTATAVTPILNEPFTGPVYFVKNVRKDPKSGREIRTLPKLVIPLRGNGILLTLTGTSDVVDNRLVTTFDLIPDAPVTSFKLNINGGKKGILAISGDKADICKSNQIANQEVDGQNGKQADADIIIATPSCKTKVLSKKTTKKSVIVKVAGLTTGKLTITGKGIKKTSRTIAKATVATITAKRTKGTPGKVTATLKPAGKAKARTATK